MFKIYKKYISPLTVVLFGHSCRFTPTCSEYADEAIKRYGIFKGGLMSVRRVIKCNPLSKQGYDPVI